MQQAVHRVEAWISDDAYILTEEEKRARRVADNRRNFPACMAVADAFRDIFGDGVRVLFASESGKKIGKMPPENGTWITAGEWLAQSARMKQMGLLAEDAGGMKQVKRGRV